MKLSNIALISAALVSAAFAGDMKFGVVAGAGMSTFTGDNADDAAYQLAWQAGAKMVMPMGGFDLAPEVLFAARGAGVDAEGVEGGTDLLYIMIPVLAQFEVGPGVQLKVGPQIAINVSATYEMDIDGFGKMDGDVEEASTLDLGLVAGAGYKINDNLAADARFEYGFMEIAKDAKVTNMGFGANVSYLF